MLEGMRADFHAIDALSQRLVERAPGEEDQMPDAGGTDFEGNFHRT
jgi:hypothetical protein